MTPLEVIRDHGTLVGATPRLGPRPLAGVRAARADPDLRRLPDRLPGEPDRRDRLPRRAAAALPDGRHLVPAAGRLRPQLPLRLPHQGPALAPLVLAAPTSRRWRSSRRPTPPSAGGSARRRSPRPTSRSASPRPPGGGCRCGCRERGAEPRPPRPDLPARDRASTCSGRSTPAAATAPDAGPTADRRRGARPARPLKSKEPDPETAGWKGSPRRQASPRRRRRQRR